ncbi:hypothetical protein OUZ56_004410 [Daphnia magna]|uniref:Uncharacterized protein n=1 Tax=Daphnia magna TaxID=35525 RepID=A0ABQ9YPQ0_9CRUS|nr:hypothetical protein OUZ56_004410 [Daphnia magna]
MPCLFFKLDAMPFSCASMKSRGRAKNNEALKPLGWVSFDKRQDNELQQVNPMQNRFKDIDFLENSRKEAGKEKNALRKQNAFVQIMQIDDQGHKKQKKALTPVGGQQHIRIIASTGEAVHQLLAHQHIGLNA